MEHSNTQHTAHSTQHTTHTHSTNTILIKIYFFKLNVININTVIKSFLNFLNVSLASNSIVNFKFFFINTVSSTITFKYSLINHR